MDATTGNEFTIVISLSPSATNKVRLKVEGETTPLYRIDVDEGDTISWKADDGSRSRIKSWLVAFMKDEGKGGPPHPGSPLGKGKSGSQPWYEIRGDKGDPPAVTNVLAGMGGQDFQFGVAVVDEDDVLYLLDPEIRVRGRIFMMKGRPPPTSPPPGTVAGGG